MKKYRKLSVLILCVELILIILCNIIYLKQESKDTEHLYHVEAKRVANELTKKSISDLNLSQYQTITDVREFHADDTSSRPYVVESANGILYRIEYEEEKNAGVIIWLNIGLGVMFAISITTLFFVGKKILQPFDQLSSYSEQLAKGNLTAPMMAEKNKFFGRFLWGLDMLRESLEEKKTQEYAMQKEKKTLILSLSHDIKTPISAIELYTKALMENVYESEEKKQEAFAGISKNATEIQTYVNQITNSVRKDFLNLEIHTSEFYLEDAMNEITSYYEKKLSVNHTDFKTEHPTNCLLKGDRDRLVEVLQNIMENAIKYGDGSFIEISYDEEEDCKLIQIKNSGSSVNQDELLNLFDSFYRGSNSKNIPGSGLGLYISKELMKKMDGDIFAKSAEDTFSVTVVVRKA